MQASNNVLSPSSTSTFITDADTLVSDLRGIKRDVEEVHRKQDALKDNTSRRALALVVIIQPSRYRKHVNVGC